MHIRRNLNYGLDTLLLAGFLNLAVTASAWGQQPQGNYHGTHMMWNGGWWHGMFFGPIFIVLLIGLVVAVVVLLLRRSGRSITDPEPSTTSLKDPLDILKDRFARGEIDKDEYEERRRILRE
jgi:putative membrane protein